MFLCELIHSYVSFSELHEDGKVCCLKLPCSSPNTWVQVVPTICRQVLIRHQSLNRAESCPSKIHSEVIAFYATHTQGFGVFFFQYSMPFNHSVLVHQLFCLYYLASCNICSAARQVSVVQEKVFELMRPSLWS